MTRHLADQLVHVVRRILQSTKLCIDGHGIAKAEERIEDEIRGGRRRLGFRLGDNTVVDLFQVLFHLVRTRELLSADRTRENFASDALVVEERVSLEAVLVLEALKYLHLFALSTSVGAVIGYEGVFEQVESADGHIGERLGLGSRLGGEVASCAGRLWWPWRCCCPA